MNDQLIKRRLCDATDEKIIERARIILNSYFERIMQAHPKQREDGKDAYICINPGIQALLMLLHEIIIYLELRKAIDFMQLSPEEIDKEVACIARPIFEYVKKASDEDIKKKFSRKFCEGVVKEYTYNLYEIIHDQISDFGSDEFKEYLKKRNSETTREANNFIMETLQKMIGFIIDALKVVHGRQILPSGDAAYRQNGIEKKAIKAHAYKKQQENSPKGMKQKSLFGGIMALKEIIQQKDNWMLFYKYFQPTHTGRAKG